MHLIIPISIPTFIAILSSLRLW